MHLEGFCWPQTSSGPDWEYMHASAVCVHSSEKHITWQCVSCVEIRNWEPVEKSKTMCGQWSYSYCYHTPSSCCSAAVFQRCRSATTRCLLMYCVYSCLPVFYLLPQHCVFFILCPLCQKTVNSVCCTDIIDTLSCVVSTRACTKKWKTPLTSNNCCETLLTVRAPVCLSHARWLNLGVLCARLRARLACGCVICRSTRQQSYKMDRCTVLLDAIHPSVLVWDNQD